MVKDSEILVLGNGQLGNKIMEKLPDARNLSSPLIDFLELDSLRQKLLKLEGVKVLINTVAWTNTESAEDINNCRAVYKINSLSLIYLVEVCRKKGWTLIHISSDYVFDGLTKNISEDDIPNPLSVYGETKLMGDLIALRYSKSYVVRTSWVIGDSFPSDTFHNFVKTMVKLISSRKIVKVVDDQFGRLTFSSTLANGITHLIRNESEYGIYNISNSGKIRSWYDIACLVKEILSEHINNNELAEIIPVSTDDWDSIQECKSNIIVPRQKNSDFNLSKILDSGFNPEGYESLLKQYVIGLIKESGVK